jgi:hypothetical protein
MGEYHYTVDLLFDWVGLVCFENKNKNVSCHTADSKPVKQEVNSTVIFPPLVFPGAIFTLSGRQMRISSRSACCQCYKTFFSSSLRFQTNKLERLFLAIL